MIARCETRAKIVEFMSTEWGISTKQAARYLSTARFRIQRLVDAKRQDLLGEALARHDELRRAGFADKNYDLVLNADKEDANLLGLYPPKKVAPTNPAGDQEYGALSDEERMKRLLAVLKEAGVEIGES